MSPAPVLFFRFGFLFFFLFLGRSDRRVHDRRALGKPHHDNSGGGSRINRYVRNGSSDQRALVRDYHNIIIIGRGGDGAELARLVRQAVTEHALDRASLRLVLRRLNSLSESAFRHRYDMVRRVPLLRRLDYDGSDNEIALAQLYACRAVRFERETPLFPTLSR